MNNNLRVLRDDARAHLKLTRQAHNTVMRNLRNKNPMLEQSRRMWQLVLMRGARPIVNKAANLGLYINFLNPSDPEYYEHLINLINQRLRKSPSRA